ncbi:MAG: hypothetical protein IJ301_05450 [Clostridia bacterium]|nr:hypothetical protein [Clostridia bacterium]
MIEKIFTNEQSMDHLDYALTCGFCFEKFIYGKGMYGNRVSLIRPKSPNKLYIEESDFKNSDFHAVEGIKSLEIAQTILIIRQKLESVLTNKACMHDFLSNFSSSFMSKEDLDATVDRWYDNVGKKLLGNKMTDFKKLNTFVLANMVLNLPFKVLQTIGAHRQKQLLDLLTQDIITADFTKSRLNLIPDTQEKYVSLKQKLMIQRTQARMGKNSENGQPTDAESKSFDGVVSA